MEYYQAIQNRAGQTVAVINEHIPALTVGTTTAASLLDQSDALNELAQERDNALVAFDAASNLENQGFLTIAALSLALPRAAEGDLDDAVDVESGLLDLLSPAYAINPRTTESALQRGQKVVSALGKIDAYLAGLVPPRGPISSGGKTSAQLVPALAAQPGLEQTVEDRAADVSTARNGLRTAATGVDRLNKRFYSRLQAEARTNPVLAEALGQIDTDTANVPGTLGIRRVLQGGTENRQVLVSYENGTFEPDCTHTLEWRIDPEAQFASLAVDPSGTALGPFPVGTTVQMRTRVTKSSGIGTTTGSIRSLTILAA